MTHHLTLWGVKSIAATSYSKDNTAWADVQFETESGRVAMTLFVPTRDVADTLANAINYANASASVQTHHDKRLSDAGLEEYRNLITEIA